MKLKWWNSFWIPACAGMTILMACSSNKPAWEYMPDMADQPSVKGQEYAKDLPHHRSLLNPPAGTIPLGFTPYPYTKEESEKAGAELKNPYPPTEEVLLAGQKMFQIYCQVCHGPKGLGDGPVIPKFPKPPSLQSEKVRGWPDGRIFHVITKGQNLMPSYASQLPAERRWKVIHYLRVLQKAEHPTPEDIEAYKKFRAGKK